MTKVGEKINGGFIRPAKGTQFRDSIDWFVDTKHGQLTRMQEVFCWRYALHGNGLRAERESFNRTTKNSQNQGVLKNLRRIKIIERIKELLRMHHKGDINLSAGPWQYYGDKLEGIGREVTEPARPLKLKELLDRVHEEMEKDLEDAKEK